LTEEEIEDAEKSLEPVEGGKWDYASMVAERLAI